MKKRISFKLWLMVLVKGFVQLICTIFSPKNKTPFWRVVCCVITLCVLAFTSVFFYAFYVHELRYYRDRDYNNREYLGHDLYFYNKGEGKGYILDGKTNEKVLKGIDWVVQSQDGEELAVFAKDGKRGFVSCRTGKVVIPAKYDAAWCYNDGVAGVCEGDSVYFIDNAGKPINNRKFKRAEEHDYMYYGDYFVNEVDGKYGLVDRMGADATPAIYTYICPEPGNMWKMKYNDKYGVINDRGIIVVPNEYKYIQFYEEGGIAVTAEDNSQKLLDYDGNVTDDFVYDYTVTMEYDTDELDKDGVRIRKAANLNKYCSYGFYGLMDKNGKPVTPPIYDNIGTYSADLYECQVAEDGVNVMLNSKGEKVN